MPNPLIQRWTQPNTSDRNMAERPSGATTPVPETYDGTNNAYRGTETHGVDNAADIYESPPEWTDGSRPVGYDPPVPDPEPIPVKVVQSSGEELKVWRARQEQLQPLGVVRPIVNEVIARRKVRIKNSAAFIIYVGEAQTVTTYTGYPIAPAGELELDAQTAVYALNPDLTNVATIAVIEQYVVSY